MSLYAFKVALQLEKDNTDFYGLIMAAMMRADDFNLIKLKREWLQVWAELEHRYNAPQGLMPGETNPETGDTYEDLMAVRQKLD